jgi:soluble lytic murein transglycosylase
MPLLKSFFYFILFFLISFQTLANESSNYLKLQKINQELIDNNKFELALEELSKISEDSVWKYYLYYSKSFSLFKSNQIDKALEEINQIPLNLFKKTKINFHDEFSFIHDVIELKLDILKSLNKTDEELSNIHWIYFEESNQSKIKFSDEVILEKISFLYSRNEWKKIIEIFDPDKIIKNKKINLAEKCQVIFFGAKALYYTSKREEAYKLMQSNIDQDCPEPYLNYSYYWKALIERRLEYKTKAIKTYQKIIDLYPDHQFTDDAYYYIVELYKDLKKDDEQKKYQEKFKNLKEGDLKEKFLWDLAFKDYQGKKYQLALSKIAHIEKGDLIADEMKFKLYYWQARIYEKLKDSKKAQLFYQKIIGEAPYSYYGLLSQKRTNHQVQFQKIEHKEGIKDIKDDLLSEYYLTIKNQLSSINSNQALELINYFRFFYLDEFNQHKDLFTDLFYQSKNYHQAIELYSEKESIHPHHFLDKKELDHQMILYPNLYSDKIKSAIKNYPKLKPYHLLGIIREESLYDEKARSVAGAYGLMQIIPTTQTWQARKVGLKNYDYKNIDHHLLIGANYIDWLIESFDGNLSLAIISYNAGPTWTKRWIKKHGKVPIDEFIEQIPFGETRYYVMRVLRSMMVYQLMMEPNKKLLPGFKLTI